VFRGRKRVAGDTEASVFAAVGLPWIPPELREDRGEIAAARSGKLAVPDAAADGPGAVSKPIVRRAAAAPKRAAR
jgi:hypothetical protein